ncbi:MAG: hypothetical protein HYV09_18045 [Deltaproteobacteria bacterium]|nr:hypothetical protein [Deltaproteobacteria bacterium]
MIERGWYIVPGPELRHRHRGLRDVRVMPGGRVIVRDPHRRLEVEAGRRWRTLPEATEIAIGLVLELDMREDARREIEARERDRRRGFSRDRTADRDEVRELRHRLDDPARVVHLLGVDKGARRQPRGLLVRCPAHEDRTPSCSVRVGADGTIACRCHGCGWTGDVLGLIAAVRGLDPRHDFARVLEEAADLAGVELRRTG